MVVLYSSAEHCVTQLQEQVVPGLIYDSSVYHTVATGNQWHNEALFTTDSHLLT